MSQNTSHASGWGSRLGFILASAGAAVGLGAIWKFPYMAGTNGGSVFMLPYIFFTLTVGVALLLAEFAMGRAGGRGAVGSLNHVCGRPWGAFGLIGVVTVFLILSFYSVVGGWCLKYTLDAFLGNGLIEDASLLGKHFGAFVSDPVVSYLFLLFFLLLTGGVVFRGVQGGIERVAKVLMPLLFLLMLVLIVRGVTLPDGWKGVEFLFTPRWSDMTGSSLFNAMGFCFFSLSLGAGTMITYGSYLSPKADLPNSVAWVALLAILSAVLGGLMVMPAVFAFGLDPTAGPGLTFVTMPAVFAKMPAGHLFAVFFYLSLSVAALTSSVSMLEACTTLLEREYGFNRRNGMAVTLLAAALVGFFANLSFGPMSEMKLAGRNFFDWLDFLTSNVGMPVSTFGIAVAAAWVAWPAMRRELETSPRVAGSESLVRMMRILIGVVAPLFVLVVAAGGLLG